MNQIKIFESPEFGNIRTVLIEDKPYFVAIDVAKALGYKDATNAVKQHCRWVVKHHVPHPQSPTKTMEVNAIPEGDIFRLVSHSELPSAEKFESWVFDEIVPSVRKYGAYMTPQKIEEVLLNPDTIIQLATSLKSEQEKNKTLSGQIEQDKPKVIFADAVSTAKSDILIGEMAKLLKQNGIDIGEKRLFEWLRENGYLIKRKGTDWNSPTQKSMDMNLFRTKETTVCHADGHTTINKTPKVTGKGQVYFINLFLNRGDVV